jgi:hypothetical protein
MGEGVGDGEMILAALALAAAAPAETSRAFVTRLYAGYAHKNYNPLDRLDRVFAPRLAAAIREDTRLAKGEVGYLDGDPICDCQDYAKLTARIRSLVTPSAASATANLHLNYGTGEARDLTLKLVLTRAGWRVADVGTKEEPSLLRALEESNRKLRRH